MACRKFSVENSNVCLNIELDDETWTQTSLPITWGSLGIRRVTDIALPAFISSAMSTIWSTRKLLPDYLDGHPYEEAEEAQRHWRAFFNNNDMHMNDSTLQSVILGFASSRTHLPEALG